MTAQLMTRNAMLRNGRKDLRPLDGRPVSPDGAAPRRRLSHRGALAHQNRGNPEAFRDAVLALTEAEPLGQAELIGVAGRPASVPVLRPPFRPWQALTTCLGFRRKPRDVQPSPRSASVQSSMERMEPAA